MKKIYEWIIEHKALAIVVCAVIFSAPLIVVHLLYKWYLGIPWLIPEWEPGDILGYVAGFEAFLGTAFLGIVSFEQNRKADEANKRLSEENNYFQKILSQKLIPVVKLSSLFSASTTRVVTKQAGFLGNRTFMRLEQYDFGIPQTPIQVINVNIDVENETPRYKKELSFSVRNVSEAILRHFCIDAIVIKGYKDAFGQVICINHRPGDGISSLFETGKMFELRMTFYFNSDRIKSIWDSETGGVGITLYSTNTTITGVRFHEYMSITVTDTGYSHISYGEKPFVQE